MKFIDEHPIIRTILAYLGPIVLSGSFMQLLLGNSAMTKGTMLITGMGLYIIRLETKIIDLEKKLAKKANKRGRKK